MADLLTAREHQEVLAFIGQSLAASGFTRVDSRFISSQENLVRLIEVRMEPRIDAKPARFFVEMGVFVPAVAQHRGKTVGDSPELAQSTVRIFLARPPSRAFPEYWLCSADPANAAEQIRRVICSEGRAWFSRVSNLAAVRAEILATRLRGRCPEAATICILLGEPQEGRRLVERELSDQRAARGYRKKLAEWARHAGLLDSQPFEDKAT